MNLIRKKVLFIFQDNILYSCGYKLSNRIPGIKNYSYYSSIKDKYGIISGLSILRRFLRAKITGCYILPSGEALAITKKGLFLHKKKTRVFEKCFAMPRGSKPLSICIAPSGIIFFGEYFQSIEKQVVNIYCSKDNART